MTRVARRQNKRCTSHARVRTESRCQGSVCDILKIFSSSSVIFLSFNIKLQNRSHTLVTCIPHLCVDELQSDLRMIRMPFIIWSAQPLEVVG